MYLQFSPLPVYDLSLLPSSACELCLFYLNSMETCAGLPTVAFVTGQPSSAPAVMNLELGASAADWHPKQGRHAANYPLLSIFRNPFHTISGPPPESWLAF